MSNKGDKVVISAGTTINAGVLTDLLKRIKNEFNRRASSGSGEALNKYISTNLSSYTSNDTAGTTITAANANNILKAIAVLSAKNSSTASNPLSTGDLIAVKIVNDAYDTIYNMESHAASSTSSYAGCKGAC